jgi:hypothetical protein
VLCVFFGLPYFGGLPFPWNYVVGSLLATIGVAYWEWRAYRKEIKSATTKFLLDRKLLRDNAVIAAVYVVLGVATVFLYRYFAFTDGEWLGVPVVWWGAAFFLGLVLIGVRLAVPWLRQKITWQKAALPYVFRLAYAGYDDHRTLQQLININPPPDRGSAPRQIVIGGPIGSGRTELCAGIGTEFAFKHVKVRYLTLAALLEFAARSQRHFADDDGPENIKYWPWSEAQVVIIDDIGPLLAERSPLGTDDVDQFRQVLNQLAKLREVLATCHTVWAMGERPQAGQIAAEALDQLAREIGNFCNSRERDVLVLQLDPRPTPKDAPSAKIRTVRAIVPYEPMTLGAHAPTAS